MCVTSLTAGTEGYTVLVGVIGGHEEEGMRNLSRTVLLAAILAVSVLALGSAPAFARGWHHGGWHGGGGWHHHRGFGAGAAILGGLLGLGAGAALGSQYYYQPCYRWQFYEYNNLGQAVYRSVPCY